MTEGQRSVESAITDVSRLQKILAHYKGKQVTSKEAKQIIKATALAWFNNHRRVVQDLLGEDQIADIDGLYRGLIAAASRATLRERYLSSVKQIKKDLGKLQAEHAIALSATHSPPPAITSDVAPRFDPLISDARMQAILNRRWTECCVCANSGAPLAATVMTGGLLEGLLLAKINQLTDRSPVFSASTAPKDRNTGKALELKDWGLKNYIDVAHELGWITKTTKDIGEVLRDYRNYIHPQKELSHNITLEPDDAKMLWEVAKSITHQLLK